MVGLALYTHFWSDYRGGYTFGWSFILGWIGVVFAVISGVFAFVKGRQSNSNTKESQSLNSSPDAL